MAKHAQALADLSVHRRAAGEGSASRNPPAIPSVKPAAVSIAFRAIPAASAVVALTPARAGRARPLRS